MGKSLSVKIKIKNFSLVELLIVVTILIILTSLLLPSLTKAIEMGNIVSCQSNIRQIHLGYSFYESDFSSYPPTHTQGFGPGPNAYAQHGYHPFALDFLVVRNQYLTFQNKNALYSKESSVTSCPSYDRHFYASYDRYYNWVLDPVKLTQPVTYSFSLYVGIFNGAMPNGVENEASIPKHKMISSKDILKPSKRAYMLDGLHRTEYDVDTSSGLPYFNRAYVVNIRTPYGNNSGKLMGLHNDGENVAFFDGHVEHIEDLVLDPYINSDRNTNQYGLFYDLAK